jgi:prepilin-type N-terminal cleavage/methylation domain-containing protein
MIPAANRYRESKGFSLIEVVIAIAVAGIALIIQIADRDELEDGGEITTLDLGEAMWEVELEETEIVDLFKMDLFIEFENPDGSPIEYREILFLLRPTWSDPIESSAILSDVRDRIEENNLRRDW